MLFLDALEDYVVYCSDPVLEKLREFEKGLDSLQSFFYDLIDALITKTFPKSCLIVNTVVELRNENPKVTDVYDRYLTNMLNTYTVVLQKAAERDELEQPQRIEEYAEFLLGVIFSLSILYKIRSVPELRQFVDDQLSMIK